jgi:large subunit ribosomal protein L1
VTRGKKYSENLKKIEEDRAYPLEEAIKQLREVDYAGFDATVEIAINLNILQKHNVRDTVALPHGTGKKVRVAVFAKAEKAKEAEEAGADFVGDVDLIEKIKGGWFDFDVAVATPDMMKDVGKIGKLLGTRGLMPNPKTGTVTATVKQTVEELKKGRVEFRADKTRIVHIGIGKLSMGDSALFENCKTLYEGVLSKRPQDLKGDYIKSIYLSSTMSPGIKVDHKAIAE